MNARALADRISVGTPKGPTEDQGQLTILWAVHDQGSIINHTGRPLSPGSGIHSYGLRLHVVGVNVKKKVFRFR